MLNEGLFTSNTNEWATPIEFFKELDKEFNFTLDPCATPENAKCSKFFTEKQNGLTQDWGGKLFFVTHLMVVRYVIGLKSVIMRTKKEQPL